MDHGPQPVLSDEVFRLIFDASPVGVGLADEFGHFVAVNPSLCRLFGRPAAELIGHSSFAFTHPDDQGAHNRAGSLVEASRDGIARVEKRYVRPDGEIRWGWLTFRHTAGPQGQVWTLAHVQDVTERVTTERALRDSEARLRAVADVVRGMTAGDDIRPEIVRAAARLAGGDIALLLEGGLPGTSSVTASTAGSGFARPIPMPAGSALAQAWSGGAARAVGPAELGAEPLPAGSADRGLQAALFVPVALRGRVVAVLVVGWESARRPEDLDPTGVISLLADQTAVAMHQSGLLQDLEILANTDELSGLPNRRAWVARLPQLMTLAERSGRSLTVALADLDHFKLFNDAHGHLVGDALIRDFARVARRMVPADGLLARWGGEEFAMALLLDPDADPRPTLERMRRAVPADQTCSIGYAIWDGDEDDRTLIERADRALYRAKVVGRDRSERAG